MRPKKSASPDSEGYPRRNGSRCPACVEGGPDRICWHKWSSKEATDGTLAAPFDKMVQSVVAMTMSHPKYVGSRPFRQEEVDSFMHAHALDIARRVYSSTESRARELAEQCAAIWENALVLAEGGRARLTPEEAMKQRTAMTLQHNIPYHDIPEGLLRAARERSGKPAAIKCSERVDHKPGQPPTCQNDATILVQRDEPGAKFGSGPTYPTCLSHAKGYGPSWMAWDLLTGKPVDIARRVE